MYDTLSSVKSAIIQLASDNEFSQSARSKLLNLANDINDRVYELSESDLSAIDALLAARMGGEGLEKTLNDTFAKWCQVKISEATRFTAGEYLLKINQTLAQQMNQIAGLSNSVNETTAGLEVVKKDLTTQTTKLEVEVGTTQNLITETKDALSTIVAQTDAALSEQIGAVSSAISGTTSTVEEVNSGLAASITGVIELLREVEGRLKAQTSEVEHALGLAIQNAQDAVEHADSNILATSRQVVELGEHMELYVDQSHAKAYAVVEARISALVSLLQTASTSLLREFSEQGALVGQYSTLVQELAPRYTELKNMLDRLQTVTDAAGNLSMMFSDILQVDKLIEALHNDWNHMSQQVTAQSQAFNATLAQLKDERQSVLTMVEGLSKNVTTMKAADTAANVVNAVANAATAVYDRSRPEQKEEF